MQSPAKTGKIKAPGVVDFFKTLTSYAHRPLMVLWDGAFHYRVEPVREYIASGGGHIVVKRLPPYARREYVWAHLKQHGIGSLAVKEV